MWGKEEMKELQKGKRDDDEKIKGRTIHRRRKREDAAALVFLSPSG